MKFEWRGGGFHWQWGGVERRATLDVRVSARGAAPPSPTRTPTPLSERKELDRPDHAVLEPGSPAREARRDCYFTVIDNRRDVAFDRVYADVHHAIARADSVRCDSRFRGRAMRYLAGDDAPYEVYPDRPYGAELTAHDLAGFVAKLSPYVSTARVNRCLSLDDCQGHLVRLLSETASLQTINGADHDRLAESFLNRAIEGAELKKGLARDPDPRLSAGDRERLAAMRAAADALVGALAAMDHEATLKALREGVAGHRRWYRPLDGELPSVLRAPH